MTLSRPVFLVLLLALPAAAQKAVDELKGQAGKDAAKGGSVADPEGKAVGAGEELKFPLEGCTAEQQGDVEKAVRAAREKVDTCLAGLNPQMAAEIARQFHKFKFYCEQQTAGAGAVTTHDTDDKNRLLAAHIRLTMRSRLVQYSRAARLFHEMIHAVDPPAKDQSAKRHRDGHFIISASRHATAGFPDPVYGCQFACYGGVGEDEAKAMTRYSKLLKERGLEIPESRRDFPPDENAGQYYDLHIKRYAYLCETGKPVVSDEILDADRAANRPTCVAEGLANACDAADDGSCASKNPPKGALCGLRCEILIDTAANGGRMPGKSADRLFSIGAAVAGAIDDDGARLEGEMKGFYADAKRRGLIKACR